MKKCLYGILFFLVNFSSVVASNICDGDLQQFYAEYFKSPQRKSNMTMIIYALKNNLPLTTEKLIQLYPEEINQIYKSKIYNQYGGVKEVIENPLSIAIENQHLEVIKLLINHHANLEEKITIDTVSPDNTVLFSSIVKRNNEEAAILLINAGADPTVSDGAIMAAHYACGIGMLDLVNKMLDNGLDPLIVDLNGDTLLTALHFYNVNDLDKAKQLINRLVGSGVDINYINKKRNNNSFILNTIHFRDIFYYSLNLGIKLKDSKSQNLLVTAVYANHKDIVSTLLSMNCNPDEIYIEKNNTKEKFYKDYMFRNSKYMRDRTNKTIPTGQSALGWCALKGNIEIAELLLHYGANPNQVDWFDETPIYNAIIFNQTNMVNLLISHGANLWYKDKENQTPIDVAVREEQWDIYDILIKELSK